MSYLREISTRETPQRERARADQVENSAGGFVWNVTDDQRVRRFLILGSEGGSYYASQRDLTKENYEAVTRAINTDGVAVVNTVIEVSEGGLAPKQSPGIFVLALCASHEDLATRKAAWQAMSRVLRTASALQEFVGYTKQFRGWGRGLRKGVSEWYAERGNPYQAIKYQQRGGVSNRDLLRLAHPKAVDTEQNTLFRWITHPQDLSFSADHWGDQTGVSALPDQIKAATELRNFTTAEAVASKIREYRLPREVVPTQFLNSPVVWEALLEEMPITALIRNLATLTRAGVVAPMSNGTQYVLERLSDTESLQRGRVHPIQLLAAQLTYSAGHGARGTNTWTPVSQITDALENAYYESFGFVEPTGKRTMLALDVSSSMGGGLVAGVPGLSPAKASAAFAMTIARTEPNHMFYAFSDGKRTRSYNYGAKAFAPLNISASQRLDDVLKTTQGLNFGGTDCALPMLEATKRKIDVDTFIVLTDSETWAGNIQPHQALVNYRQKFVGDARLIVVGMVSNGFTIADPTDSGMLDVVGFDLSAPKVISEFSGRTF